MMRFRVDKSDRRFIKPRQVERASRLAINAVTNEAHKELGGAIPTTHGTSIMGFRRVRSKKTLAKVRRKSLKAIVWEGTKEIKATYAGKARNVKGGIRAGKHFFPGAFIMKFKSDHVGIFKRMGGQLVEETIDLPQAHAIVKRAGVKALHKLPGEFRKQYKRLIK